MRLEAALPVKLLQKKLHTSFMTHVEWEKLMSSSNLEIRCFLNPPNGRGRGPGHGSGGRKPPHPSPYPTNPHPSPASRTPPFNPRRNKYSSRKKVNHYTKKTISSLQTLFGMHAQSNTVTRVCYFCEKYNIKIGE